MTKAVCLSRVCRYFGTVKALDGVDLQVEDGEFFGLLGPSGSGKTTCLRIIAGFDSPTSGEIEIAGRRSESVPPYRRDVSTVFQDYALFPHMNVVTNVAYGLMVRGVNKTERIARAREALALVKLSGYDERRPSELSGGQRQRVALARSIVTQPSVLLLDEPLGALDLKLREQMQAELKSLQRELGITFVFVTHDQSEALSMSDRIAIFDDGQIRQIGTPQEVYERPANAFVANFVGGSNVVDTRMIPGIPGEQGSYSLRPEKITIGPGPADAVTLTGKISEVQYQGATYRISIDLGESSLTTVQPVDGDEQITPGDSITVWFHRRHLHPMTVN